MPEERITAWLRIRDRLRFKEGMKSAARSVRELGEDTEQSAAKMEVLNRILKAVEHQTVVTAAGFRVLANSIEEAGEEATSTAVKTVALNRALSLNRLGLRRNLTTWRFWKDRLSLTASEVKSVAITVGTYLSPAIVLLGTSLAGAAVGGAAVLTTALGVLAVGVGGLALNASLAANQFQKVSTAQNAYNLAIKQYGEGSKQAASAAGKLYAVIQTQGGRPVWNAVRAVNALRDSWTKATAPGRADMFGILGAGVTGARRLLPTFARQTNLGAGSLRRGLTGAFNALSGGETKLTLRVLGQTARALTGPAIRSGVNVLIVLFRIMRATAPFLVTWVKGWEAVTSRWRRNTRDASKLESVIRMLVGHLTSWARLFKALGTTFLILFTGGQATGKTMVDTITELVDKLNTWLALQVRTGGFQRLAQQYTHSLGQFFQALGTLITNPSAFFDQWFPKVANVFANGMGKLAAVAVREFLEAWWHADIWGKIFIPFLLIKYLTGINIFGRLASAAASKFVGSFAAFAGPRLALFFGAEGLIGSRIAIASESLGRVAGRRFAAGLIAGIVLMLPEIRDAIANAVGIPTNENPSQKLQRLSQGQGKDPIGNWLKDKIGGIFGGGGALGGMLGMGQIGLVGENGPELAFAGAAGTMIRPLPQQPPQTPEVNRGALSLSDQLPPFHIHLDVEKREIAHAVYDWNNQRKARRGER